MGGWLHFWARYAVFVVCTELFWGSVGPSEVPSELPVITVLAPPDGHVFRDNNIVDVSVEVDRSAYHGTLPNLVFRVNSTVLQTLAPKEGPVHEHAFVITDLPNGEWRMSVGFEDEPFTSTTVGFSVRIIVQTARVREWPDLEEEKSCEGGSCPIDAPIEAFTESDVETFPLCNSQNFIQRANPAKIFDAFTFHDEIDLLEVRLFELSPIVHKFIIVEANLTHQLDPKPLYLDRYLDRLAPYSHQIIRVEAETRPFELGGSGGGWGLEAAQRNAILKGLTDANEQDLVVISDLDEIPKRRSLQLLRVCHGYTAPVFMMGHLHYYGLHLEFRQRWHQGPKVVLRDMLYLAVTPTLIRRLDPTPPSFLMMNGSWHLSFFVAAQLEHGAFDIAPIERKLRSFANAEHNYPEFLDPARIRKCIDEDRDLMDHILGERMQGLVRVGAEACTEDRVPRLLLHAPERFPAWITHCPAAQKASAASDAAEPPAAAAQPPRAYRKTQFASWGAWEILEEDRRQRETLADAAETHRQPSPAESLLELWKHGAEEVPLYRGLEGHALLRLRDAGGRPVSCWEVEQLNLTFDPPTSFLGSKASCADDDRSLIAICFVSTDPQVNISARVAGQHVAGSPLSLSFLPTAAAARNPTCHRPGVSSAVTHCPSTLPSLLDLPALAAAEDDAPPPFPEEPGASHVEQAGHNVFAAQRVCVANRTLLLFASAALPPGEYKLPFAARFWGRTLDPALHVRLKVLPTSWHVFHAEHHPVHWPAAADAGPAPGDDGEHEPGERGEEGEGGVAWGASPLYVVPEGPTVHFGHMLMDSALALFATAALVEDASPRKRVLLWPLMMMRCPTVGQRLHSRRFVDFFRALTAAPRADVLPLAALGNRAVCAARAVIGQSTDQRTGYWRNRPSRAVPYLEETAAFVQALRRGFRMPPLAPRGSWAGGAGGEAELEALLVVRRVHRRMHNEEAVVQAVQGAGFRVRRVSWDGQPLAAQLRLVEGADAMAGIHGAELNNVLFARPGSVLVEFIPYCWANASDFWEMAVAARVRHYAWRNPDPARALCPPHQPTCLIPDHGHSPPSSMFLRGGGDPDIRVQDTVVDAEVVAAIAADAAAFLLHPPADPRERLETSCSVDAELGGVACSHVLPAQGRP